MSNDPTANSFAGLNPDSPGQAYYKPQTVRNYLVFYTWSDGRKHFYGELTATFTFEEGEPALLDMHSINMLRSMVRSKVTQVHNQMFGTFNITGIIEVKL